jgi:hypothetical protein
VTTQHQSNSQGTAGSFQSSTGAEGAGVKGAGGNSAGIAKSASGNVYAGADGNVYKHTDDGWSKWNDGSWTPVTPSTNSNRNSSQNLSGQTRQSGSQQNLSGETRQSGSQNLAGETQRMRPPQENLSGATQGMRPQSANLSGETEGAGRFRGGAAESRFGEGGFQQLENDRFARTQGAQREANFGGMRQGGRMAGAAGRFRR